MINHDSKCFVLEFDFPFETTRTLYGINASLESTNPWQCKHNSIGSTVALVCYCSSIDSCIGEVFLLVQRIRREMFWFNGVWRSMDIAVDYQGRTHSLSFNWVTRIFWPDETLRTQDSVDSFKVTLTSQLRRTVTSSCQRKFRVIVASLSHIYMTLLLRDGRRDVQRLRHSYEVTNGVINISLDDVMMTSKLRLKFDVTLT